MKFMKLLPAISVSCLLASSAMGANLLWNSSFEFSEPISGAMVGADDWGRDYSRIAGFEQGISPYDGTGMVRFVNTTFWEGLTAGVGGEVAQLVPLAPYLDLVRAGRAMALGSAWFNRVAGDSETDTLFRVNIMAYQGAMADYPVNAGNYLSYNPAMLESDADPSTWEYLKTSFQIPSDADYLVYYVAALENIHEDQVNGEIEFDGHYADMTFLTIVPEPRMTAGTTCAVLIGLAISVRKRRQSAAACWRKAGSHPLQDPNG